MANEWETLELLTWLSKAIIAINWFNGGIQANKNVAEHKNECRCIKQTGYHMYHKTPEHALKSKFEIFVLV